MSEVKRWAHHVTWDGELKIQATMMALRSNGEYVLASDYDALAAECERWKTRCQYNADTAHDVAAERDAALAELAALKGGQAKPQLIIGSTYASTRGFGRLLYLGETHDIDGWLHTFRATDGARKHYRYDQLPDVLEEFAAPPAQASAWVPEGYALVPTELLDLYNFMAAAFAPTNRQQDEIAISLNLAKKAMLAAAAPTPGASDGKG